MIQYGYMHKRIRARHGFTIVELMVVIAIIGLLAAITVFAIGGWRERTAKTEVQAALSQLSSALKDYSNFNNTYPVPPAATYTDTNYKQSDSVTITYTATASTYCAQGTSTSVSSVVFKITDSNQTPTAGTC